MLKKNYKIIFLLIALFFIDEFTLALFEQTITFSSLAAYTQLFFVFNTYTNIFLTFFLSVLYATLCSVSIEFILFFLLATALFATSLNRTLYISKYWVFSFSIITLTIYFFYINFIFASSNQSIALLLTRLLSSFSLAWIFIGSKRK